MFSDKSIVKTETELDESLFFHAVFLTRIYIQHLNFLVQGLLFLSFKWGPNCKYKAHK